MPGALAGVLKKAKNFRQENVARPGAMADSPQEIHGAGVNPACREEIFGASEFRAPGNRVLR